MKIANRYLPENRESIQRQSSKNYRVRLGFYSAIMVAFCFAILYAIIHLSLLFSPLKSVAADVRNIANGEVDDTVIKFRQLDDNISRSECFAPAASDRNNVQGPENTQVNCEAMLAEYNEVRTALFKLGTKSDHNLYTRARARSGGEVS